MNVGYVVFGEVLGEKTQGLPAEFAVCFEDMRPHMKGVRTETGTYKQEQINEVQSKGGS